MRGLKAYINSEQELPKNMKIRPLIAEIQRFEWLPFITLHTAIESHESLTCELDAILELLQAGQHIKISMESDKWQPFKTLNLGNE